MEVAKYLSLAAVVGTGVVALRTRANKPVKKKTAKYKKFQPSGELFKKDMMITTPDPTLMISHYVLWSFKEGTSPAAIAAAIKAAEGLCCEIPGCVSAKVSKVVNGARAKGFQYQYCVVLENKKALAGFGQHEAHLSLVKNHIKPIIADLCIWDVEGYASGRPLKLVGKHALITGSSSGIGAEVAVAFAREGCDVVINYPTGNFWQSERAVEVAAKVRALGRRALIIEADITVEDEVKAMVAKTIEEFGKCDILVNNAGMASAALCENMTAATWDMMLKVNTRGLFLCTRALLPHMYDRNYGKIINTASQLAYLGAPTFAHYCATKGAILSFTRSIAKEVGKRNVRVNAVGPGATDTPILSGVDPLVLKFIEGAIPRGRMATPQEISPAYVFLASDENNAFVGQCLSPNGGDMML